MGLSPRLNSLVSCRCRTRPVASTSSATLKAAGTSAVSQCPTARSPKAAIAWSVSTARSLSSKLARGDRSTVVSQSATSVAAATAVGPPSVTEFDRNMRL